MGRKAKSVAERGCRDVPEDRVKQAEQCCIQKIVHHFGLEDCPWSDFALATDTHYWRRLDCGGKPLAEFHVRPEVPLDVILDNVRYLTERPV